MLIRKVQLCILFFFIFHAGSIQGQVPIGHWRDHFSYNHGIGVENLGDRIFCATRQALFFYTKSNFEIAKFSKIQGLSDIKISKIKYIPYKNTLLVAYENGNIDLIQDQEIINLSDIFRANISASKKINNIFYSDHFVYLSCDFGITLLDLEKNEFKDTYYIGENGSFLKVSDLLILNSKIYAATENGILTADQSDLLLVDFSHWEIIPGTQGKQYTAIATNNTELFVNQRREGIISDSILRFNGSEFSFLTTTGGPNYSLIFQNGVLVLTGNKTLQVFDENLIQTANINSYGYGSMDPRDAVVEPDGTLWLADYSFGLIGSPDLKAFNALAPNGPYYSDAFMLTFSDQTLWVAGGQLTSGWGNTWKNGEWFIFQANHWTSHFDFTVKDILYLLPNPFDPGLLYAATWGNGLLQINNEGASKIFDKANSSLQGDLLAPASVKIRGLLFDADQNLWVTNSNVSNPVSVMQQNGNWKSYHFNGLISNQTLGTIVMNSYGDKWVTLPKKSSLFVFNEEGTPQDESDDRYRKVSLTDEEGKSFNRIEDIKIDLDKNIWIGTDRGILVIYNPEDALYGGSIEPQRIKIPRNDGSGLADYLLSTELVTSIAIDGANRKWFGTQNAGAFLFSSDGTKEIKRFDIQNSPLPSNKINSIVIDPDHGEVFFGTSEGVISYRGTATSGTTEMNAVYAFPNPVRPEYSGPITITGMVANAYVKITDINGNLVFETRSLGGQAIWNGKTLDNKKAHSGVYLVFISNDDGSETFITKILFLH